MLTKTSDLPIFRLSDSPAFVSVHTDQTSQPNIRVECEVAYWDDLKWVTVGIDTAIPNQDGICRFSLSEYFSPFVKPKFSYPQSTSFIEVYKDITKSFKIIFKEYYGNPPDLKNSLETGTYYFTIKGSVPDHFSNLFFSKYESFFDKISQNDMRLSFEHLDAVVQNKTFERRVSEKDNIKLFAIAKTYTGPIDVTVTLVFSDFTTGLYIPEIPQGLDAYRGNIIEFNVGYQNLGIAAYMHQYYPTKTLIYYYVFCRDFFNGLLFPQHKFILDYTEKEQRYEFLFLNSLGAYDTFTATGQSDVTMKYEGEVLDLPFWHDMKLKQRKITTKIEEIVRCNTGFVTKDTLFWLPELFASEEVYLLNGNKAIPVTIMPGEIIRSTDEPSLYNVEFEYSPTAQMKHDGFDIPIIPFQPTLTMTFNNQAGQIKIIFLDGTSFYYSEPVSFNLNQLIGIQAIPAEGYMFLRFTGDANTHSPSFDITMNTDKNITALFAQLPANHFILTIIILGAGTVKVNGNTYSEPISILTATTVTLEAIPEPNGYFAGFYHNNQLYSYSPYTFTMNNNYIIKAYFSL